MELSKKTTILLTQDMHRRLRRLARERGTSLGGLVREAVTTTYGLHATEARVRAVDELASLALPVGPVEEMIRESSPAVDEPLPRDAPDGGPSR